MFSITKKQASRWILIMSVFAVAALALAVGLLLCTQGNVQLVVG